MAKAKKQIMQDDDAVIGDAMHKRFNSFQSCLLKLLLLLLLLMTMVWCYLRSSNIVCCFSVRVIA